MKGYSFQELVKLAEAAVKRAGDTMTGNLTAPAVLVSSAQNTSANALTRKDYVDNELSKKLSLTGGTMTGALYINQELQSRTLSINDISSGARLALVPQGSNERFTIDMYPTSSPPYQVIEFKGSDRTASFKQVVSCDVAPVAATHLTRKDYVDGQIATRATSKNNFAARLGVTRSISGTTRPNSVGVWSVDDSTWAPHPWGTLFVTSNRGDELTPSEGSTFIHYLFIGHDRRIYVATDVNGSMSPWSAVYDTMHKPTAADVGAVSKSGDTMTGNLFAPAVLVSSTQDASGNALTRKDYVDGQVAARAPMAHTHTAADVGAVSKAGDIMTGSLQVRSGVDASGVHVYGGGGGGAVGLVDATGTQRTNFHYNGATGIGSINTYNASGVWVSEVAKWDSASGFGALYPYSTSPQRLSDNALTRKDYVDTQVATRAPTTHTHTAARGNSDIVAGEYGQVGTYIFAQVSTGSTPPPHDLTVGDFIAGSSLRPCSVDSDPDDLSQVALSGTWKCLGRSRFGNGEADWTAAKTLWIRIT